MKNNKIQIYINGKKKLVNTNNSLYQILKLFKLNKKFIAIEVNRQVVPKSLYKSKIVFENDAIEVVEFIGGG